jgi:hypothetical protein
VRLEQSRYAEAARLAKEAQLGLDRQQPSPKIESGFVRVIYSAAQLESGRPGEALELALASRERLSGVMKPTHWMSQFAEAAVGCALVNTGDRAQARAILDPVQALHEKNKAGGWRAAWIRRCWQKAHK